MVVKIDSAKASKVSVKPAKPEPVKVPTRQSARNSSVVDKKDSKSKKKGFWK